MLKELNKPEPIEDDGDTPHSDGDATPTEDEPRNLDESESTGIVIRSVPITREPPDLLQSPNRKSGWEGSPRKSGWETSPQNGNGKTRDGRYNDPAWEEPGNPDNSRKNRWNDRNDYRKAS